MPSSTNEENIRRSNGDNEMNIETIIVIIIALILPLLTEWRMKRMIKKTLKDPETPKRIAELIKKILREYRHA